MSEISRVQEQVRAISQSLYLASQPIRILSHLNWPATIREDFLRTQGQKLPRQPEYPQIDFSSSRLQIELALKEISDLPEGAVRDWLDGTAQNLLTSTFLLSSCGTSDFLKFSRELYGLPTDTLTDSRSTPLSLAQKFRELFQSLDKLDLGAPYPACYLAEHVAERMGTAVQVFGDQAPNIRVVDELSANALAGSQEVKIRRGACFSELDIKQLIQHELYVHVATSLNGQTQSELPILAASHAGTTKTQEGLAVFAELISGTIDLDRFQRLADRVLAIQMAIDGADFIEVYRFFLEQTRGNREQAFENARRVFRGGLLQGGVPFTKDVVYLDGLLRVHNFLRMIVSSGRSDCLSLIFVGKIDIEDLPAMAELRAIGLCQPPRFLPPWAKDLRFLISYLAYSAFLNTVDLHRIRQHFAELISKMPLSS